MSPHAVRSAEPHRTARAHRAAPTRVGRERRAGGPQDRALYRCGCGHASVQAVTTTVACPVCGSTQDW